MSLLWPETLYVGLFPGHCWLESKRVKIEHPFSFDHSSIDQIVIHVLDALLSQHRDSFSRVRRVVITVSDRFGAAVILPWHDELRTTSEIDNYAQICFEKNHLPVDRDWIMHTEFFSFRENGLAYAFPQAWVEQVISVLTKHHLLLQRLLPISAAFYCKQKQLAKKGKVLLVLSEAKHTTGLIFDRKGLLGVDVEPVLNTMDESNNRLLRRVAVNHKIKDEPIRIGFWSPAIEVVDRDLGFVSNILENAKVEQIARRDCQ